MRAESHLPKWLGWESCNISEPVLSPAIVVGVGVAAVTLEQAQEEVLPLGFLDPGGWLLLVK